jgi:hypothetical protein|nr:MAG TPA: hypothetical protein [Bacteriophage sp.]
MTTNILLTVVIAELVLVAIVQIAAAKSLVLFARLLEQINHRLVDQTASGFDQVPVIGADDAKDGE